MTLAGRGVVITRPAGEAERLARLVQEAGGVPMLHPAIAILDAPDPARLDALIDRLDEFDLAIFISPSAVDKGMTRITARRTQPMLPVRLRIAAIGPGGVRALSRFGVNDVIAPQGARPDSESLLATNFMQNIAGLNVLIFRGDGGREWLGDTLKARGAKVEYATCYRRARPVIDVAALNSAARARRIAAVVFTSSEGVRNFSDSLDDAGRAWLRVTPVVVPHPRIAAAARALGCTHVVESVAGDEALMQAVLTAALTVV